MRGVLGNPKGAPQREVEFLADTGAFLTAIPKELAFALKLKPAGEISVTSAGKRETEAPISPAYFRLLDRESIVPTVIIDVPKPLLGTSALEGLGLKVDPVAGRLEHAQPFGTALL